MRLFVSFCQQTSGFENGEVGFGGDVDKGFIVQIALLTNPKILNIGWGDRAVFDADSFGSTFGSFDFGLSVEFFRFKVCTGFFNFDFSVLFGFGKYDAFPVDVWIKKAIEKYFPGEFDPSRLGPYAGVAQQYLFYYERYLGGE